MRPAHRPLGAEGGLGELWVVRSGGEAAQMQMPDTNRVGRSEDGPHVVHAAYIVEQMDRETLYLFGPGTTVKAISDEMRLSKTLLGVDAVAAGKLVGIDLYEKEILNLLKTYEKRKIVVTPIGGNGFIFGRGSKQLSPEVIKQVGRENIMVVGTKDKVNRLDCLRVDTGDFEVDMSLCGYLEVMVGHKEGMMVEVKC